MIIDVVKVFFPLTISFTIGVAITPIITHYLYAHKMWKKKARTQALGGGETPLFNKLHKDKEVNTPRMGGIVIWGSVILTIACIWIISFFFPGEITSKLDFLSRNQTWLPLFTLISASILGLIDDFLTVGGKGGYIAGGIPLSIRILVVGIIGLIGAWWFFDKLEVASIIIPFSGPLALGWLFIPTFVLIMIAVFSGGVIDGIDGLAGGVMAIIFSAYGVISFFQNQIDLAAFCAVVVGGILAFLWFNIPPARFYMSETGVLGLTTSLTVVAFLTEQVAVLPIIAFPLFAVSFSVILQIASKKFLGRKLFLIAPIHHHFEALGWPGYKVTMRFWILTVIFAMVGLIIALIG